MLLPPLLQELLVHRKWSVDAHPEWLVFEAEQQLQIRPAQHSVANYLMRHPGAIVQLNMGEGKTRVILPMLILHWAKGQQLVRRCLPACLPACLPDVCLVGGWLRCAAGV